MNMMGRNRMLRNLLFLNAVLPDAVLLNALPLERKTIAQAARKGLCLREPCRTVWQK